MPIREYWKAQTIPCVHQTSPDLLPMCNRATLLETYLQIFIPSEDEDWDQHVHPCSQMRGFTGHKGDSQGSRASCRQWTLRLCECAGRSESPQDALSEGTFSQIASQLAIVKGAVKEALTEQHCDLFYSLFSALSFTNLIWKKFRKICAQICIYLRWMSQRTTKPTVSLVRPAKSLISLRICTGWSES